MASNSTPWKIWPGWKLGGCCMFVVPIQLFVWWTSSALNTESIFMFKTNSDTPLPVISKQQQPDLTLRLTFDLPAMLTLKTCKKKNLFWSWVVKSGTVLLKENLNFQDEGCKYQWMIKWLSTFLVLLLLSHSGVWEKEKHLPCIQWLICDIDCFLYVQISVESYLDMACSVAVLGGGSNKEYALHILHRCNGNVKVTIMFNILIQN